MTETEAWIDGVIAQAYASGASYKPFPTDHREAALAAISVLVEGCIGEDETEYSNLDGNAGYWEKHGRNQLRKEIRDNLREKGLLL